MTTIPILRKHNPRKAIGFCHMDGEGLVVEFISGEYKDERLLHLTFGSIGFEVIAYYYPAQGGKLVRKFRIRNFSSP